MPKNSGGMSFTRQKYIHSIPQSKIRVFNMGDKKGEYSHVTLFKSAQTAKISSETLEAVRVTANKVLENSGKPYLLRILIYPHEITREHKFMGFAGADRLSQGMSKSFGKSTGRAARISAGQDLIAIYTKSDAVDIARTALKRASKKMPISYTVVVEEIGAEETKDVEA